MLLNDITVTAKIYESADSLVYRGVLQSENTPLILKVLKQDYPTRSAIARYKQEYEIARSLNIPGAIAAYSQQTYQRTLVILFEDFGGESLHKWMTELPSAYSPMPLLEFLRLAIKITEILGEIHAAHIIHKDINPSNIVLNPKTGIVKIIDFGIATSFSHSNPTFKNPNVIEGTLPYISPEQTGRMNRLLDYRTDFYSLGVTCYELLTGQLPFTTTDVLELVHCHIAKQPLPPYEIRGRVACPKVVSDIVMKLMAKNAEERYQSSRGIIADLEECQRQLETTGRIEEFQLGVFDISDKFQIPQKLYGREAEIQALLAAFDRVAYLDKAETQSIVPLQDWKSKIPNPKSKIEMMLVAGYSGIGKSALVQEIYKPITKKRGYFLTGKFDQFRRNIPYSAVVGAFVGLVYQLLTESESDLRHWREKLLTALGTNGQVIIDVIPEVELIIGKQPPVLDVGSTEAQNRFHLVFQSFIRVFASKEHPLVIFLDDLQWADLATLKLIELMMTDEQMQYLFLIGAYRNNEVETDYDSETPDGCKTRKRKPLHPLMMTVEKLRKQGAVVNSITLSPLTLEPIAQLIAETLHTDVTKVKHFAELVVRKTDGNPFFVNEFLKTLYSENLIAFNYHALAATPISNFSRVRDTTLAIPTFWQWDLTRIEAQGIADNVVELMIHRLKKLPDSTQQILRLAACVGSDFDLNTLSVIGEKTQSEIFQDLILAVRLGLLLPTSELDDELLIQDFKFLHDRVQQAAYALIDDSKKQVVHLQIGQLLLQNSQPETLLDEIFKIVDHFNLGVMETPQNLSQQERDEIAQLNLMAGQKAIAATAYDAAAKYFNNGRSLLSFNSWNTNYKLTLALYESAAEVEYLCGNFAAMEKLAFDIHHHAKTVFDEVKVYDVKIQAAASQGNLKQAIKIGLMVLERLDVRLPEEPSQVDVQTELEKTSSLLASREITDLINLREMTQPAPLAAMQILSSITSLTFIAAPNLFSLISLSEVNLSIQHGHATWSPHGYVVYGIVLCGIIGDIQAGYKFGRLALNLTKKFNFQEVKAKIYTPFGASVMHWQEHLKESIPILQESYQSAVETGSFEYVGYCGFHLSEHLYFTGRELTGLEQEIAIYSQVIDGVRRESPLNWIGVLWQSVLNLLGRSENPQCLIGSAYDEERSLSRAIEVNDRSEIHFYYLNKLILTYLFGNYHQAVNYGMMAEQYLDGVTARVAVAIFYFYDSLAHLSAFSEASIFQKEVWMHRIHRNQEKMQKWATHAPMNFQHKYDLVAAEKARLLDKILEAEEFYERAIQGARDNEYFQEEALAYELAAKFYLGRDRTKIARIYMIEAHYSYKRWGAKAKVLDLEAKYPELLIQVPTANDTLHSNIIGSRSKNALDLSTVMKASLVISGEMELQKLLDSLMKILIENAGAQIGFLILQSINSSEHEGEWAIEATGEIDAKADEKIATTVLQSIPIKDKLPISIINYVVRTRESLVLNNAAQEGNFTRDSYVQLHQPQSILCTPLINQGQLSGIVYLENNLITGAFSADRLQVIQLLSGQAAISITNAKLYAEVTQQKSQLTQLIDAMPVGVIVHNATGQTTYANQKAMELCNINTLPEAKIEQLAQTYQAYITGTDKLYPTELLPTVRSLAGETLQVDDMELHHPDRIVSLEVSSTPIFDETGKITQAIAAFQDITQRKQAQKLLADYNQTLEQQVVERTLEIERKQEVLQEQKELLQTIFNNIPVMVALFDAQNNIKLVNRELERVLGWSQNEIDNIDLLAECYPDPEHRASALEHIATASGKWQDVQTKVRSGCYVDTSWASIRLSNGMIINIGQDNTERKQAEVASILEERNRIAREIHDTLAQVLTGVVVHMEAAKVVISEDSKARTHVTQAQNLARDGLTEARRSVLAIRPPILEQGSLSQTLASLANRLTAGTQLKTQCQIQEAPKDLPQQVESNLLRVAQEAIVNTLRYAQANTIQVELTFESQAIYLRVRDDGRGFQSKLESSKGFGLIGMRERIQALGGKLTITSQPGEGTAVLAVVPLF